LGNFFEPIKNSYISYARYLLHAIKNPSWDNYFYWLILVSLIFFILEWSNPWRKNQAKFRKDFWLDLFYLFFNFFLFSLIIYAALSRVIVNFVNDLFYQLFHLDLTSLNPLNGAPLWLILIIGFIVRDFIQWWIHRLLHKIPFLWKFHQVHHSVEQMGFAAHLRFHWMETVLYRTIEYLPLAFLGIGLYDFFIIHIFTLSFGHYNHSNLAVSGKFVGLIIAGLIGTAVITSSFDITVLQNSSSAVSALTYIIFCLFGYFVLGSKVKYIFNSPEMHIWHHGYEMPSDKPNGINFGLTLSIWDYLFKTAYMPYNGRDIKLGFPGVEKFPSRFFGQFLHGIIKKNN
jgi:sterol desaturase/sphingolipid hydroxylase (fatty acid hydroxylase superfamily)